MQYKVWQNLKERDNATSHDIAQELDENLGSVQQALRNLRKKGVVGYRLIDSPFPHGAERKLYYIKQEEAKLPKPTIFEV